MYAKKIPLSTKLAFDNGDLKPFLGRFKFAKYAASHNISVQCYYSEDTAVTHYTFYCDINKRNNLSFSVFNSFEDSIDQKLLIFKWFLHLVGNGN